LHKIKPFSSHKEEDWAHWLATSEQSDVTCPCKSLKTDSNSPLKCMTETPSRLAAPYLISSEFNN
jgi:hypothetical protein